MYNNNMVMINGVRNEQDKESFSLKNGYSKKGAHGKMVYPSTRLEVISELGLGMTELAEIPLFVHKK